MDLEFRFVDRQTRAQDNDPSVKDLLACNKAVRDAKTDNIEVTLACFGGTLLPRTLAKKPTSSQAGLILMYAADPVCVCRL